jgi:hypothetical protein
VQAASARRKGLRRQGTARQLHSRFCFSANLLVQPGTLGPACRFCLRFTSARQLLFRQRESRESRFGRLLGRLAFCVLFVRDGERAGE